MDNTNVAPIDHGVLSATGNVAAGAAIGGVKGGVKTYLKTTLICAGVAAAATLLFIATGGIGAAFSIGTISNIIGQTALFGTLGGLFGAAVVAPFTSVFGGLFGAAKGGVHAADRVRAEKGLSNEMQAQVDVYRAQATAIAANDNKYNLPAQGTVMNPAGTTVNNVVLADRVNGQQLQRA